MPINQPLVIVTIDLERSLAIQREGMWGFHKKEASMYEIIYEK